MGETKVPCHCLAQHGEDTITFRDRLDYTDAMTISNAPTFVAEEDMTIRPARVLAVMSRLYAIYGVTDWTITDDHGRKVAVNPENVTKHLLEVTDVAVPLTEALNDQYQPQVLLPLVSRAESSSPPTPITKSTSVKSSRSPRRSPKPSPPSSTSTIPTAGTETTSSSLVGVSSSSQSSESAA